MTTRPIVRLALLFSLTLAAVCASAGVASADQICGYSGDCADLRVTKLVADAPGGPWVDANTPGTALITDTASPKTLYYKIELRDAGDTSIHITSINDTSPDCNNSLTLTPASGDTDSDGYLDPGETWTYLCSHVWDPATESNPYFNNAWATGDAYVSLYGWWYLDQNDVAYARIIDPKVTITKTGPPEAHEGDSVTYTYSVSNSYSGTASDSDLDNVVVTDDKCGPVSAPSQNGQPVPTGQKLKPGDTWSFSCTYTIPGGSPDKLTNTATVNATDEAGGNVSDTATHTLTVEHPSFTLDKQGPGTVKAGDSFKWKITLTNTGNSALAVDLTEEGCDAAPQTVMLGDGDDQEPQQKIVYCYDTAPNDGTTQKVNEACGIAKDELGGVWPTQPVDTTKPPTQVCDEATVRIIHPALKVTKTVQEHGLLNGDTLHYHVVIQNTGDVPLTVTWADTPGLDQAADTGCGNFSTSLTQTTLAPETQFVFDCSHGYDAQTDGDTPRNTACAYGALLPEDRPDTAQAEVVLQPDATACDSVSSKLSELTLQKTGTDTAHEGHPVSFDYQLTNTGKTSLTNVTLSDDTCPGVQGPYAAATGTTAPPSDTLHADETWYYHCTYTLGTGLADSVTNTATATGHPESGPDVSATAKHTTKVLHGNFSITKSGPLYAVSNEGFDWTITVTNTGNADLFVHLTEYNCTLAENDFWLPAGAKKTITCSANAPNDGTVILVNKVCADAHDDLYDPQSSDQAGKLDKKCAQASTMVVHPRLQVTKTVDEKGAPSGDTLHYHVTIVNTGDTILLVTPQDYGCDEPWTNPATGEVWQQTQWTLGPGSQFSFDCTHFYDVPESATGSDRNYTNEVCAYGLVKVDYSAADPVYAGGLPGVNALDVGYEPPHDVKKCAQATTLFAEIHLLKNGYQDNNPVHYVHEGDTVTYHYEIENTGEAPLHDVTLRDLQCSPITGPTENDFPPASGTLAKGKKWEYECQQVMPPPGDPRRIPNGDKQDTFTNDAVATAQPDGGSQVKEDAEHTVTFIHPALRVDKVGPKAGVAGEDIAYSMTVTNTGDTDLYNVQLTDANCSFDGGTPAAFDLPRGATSDRFYCNAPAANDPGQLTDGTFENTACATGVDIVARDSITPSDINKGTATDCDTVTTKLVHPQLEVIKTVDKTAANPGDVLHYTVTVINKGDIEMWVNAWDNGCENPLPKTHGELTAYGSVNFDGSHADRFTFTCTHTFDPGEGEVSYTNTACAKGWITDGVTDLPEFNLVSVQEYENHPCRIDQSCGADSDHYDAKACGAVTTWKLGKLEITKTKAGGELAHEGDSATFNYEVRNTGDVPLDNLKVADDKCAPDGDAPMSGPKEDGFAVPAGELLQPGHTWTWTCTYTLGEHPFSPNEIVNTAQASGVGPGDGHVKSDPVKFTTTTIHPDLTLTKTGPLIGIAGEEVPYTLHLKNTGDTDLEITLEDVGCHGLAYGKINLSPGAYTTRQCSVLPANDPGLPQDKELVNTACATGVDTLGGPKGTVKTCDTIHTPLVHPQLSVSKTVDEATADYQGVLHYHVTVTNTGDIEMAVDASDAGCDEQSVQGPTSIENLDKGASFTFTCTHQFTSKDGSSYTNEACADGYVNTNDVPDQSQITGYPEGVDAQACGDATTKLAHHTASGQAFVDVTANGLHDPGEPPLPGVLVYADVNNDGSHQPSEPSAVSDANGAYTIPVDLGTTVIRAQMPDGSTCSFPATCSHTVTMQNGQPVVVSRPARASAAAPASAQATDATGTDFGAWSPGSVVGSVFKDDNHNGLHDAGEGGIFNATAYADLNNNGILDAGEPSITTSATGAYTIGGLKPGSYVIRQLPVANSDCTAPSGCSYSVTVTSGAQVGSLDFLNGAKAAAGQLVLGERTAAGTARLLGKTGCASRPFRASVRGTGISSVVFKLDGHLIGRGSANASANEFFVRIDPRRLAHGKHRVVATVTFTSTSATKSKKLVLTFQRCAAQLRAPAFTGTKGRH